MATFTEGGENMTLHPIDGGPARRATDPADPDFEATCLGCGRRTDDLDEKWLCEDCAADDLLVADDEEDDEDEDDLDDAGEEDEE